MARIALLPGDGVGPEVVREAVRVLEVVARHPGLSLEWDEWDLGAARFLRTGESITATELTALDEEYDLILIGAFGDPRVPSGVHARDILLGLRFRLDLYVNFRPFRVLRPGLSALRHPRADAMHVEFFRENTEGVYAGIGGVLREGMPGEVAIEEDVNTRVGVERIVRASFEFARERKRARVTLVDKANAMRFAGALWRRVFDEVAGAFGEIETETMYVDAMAMDLVRRPDHHRVIVTSNLFGDILSDLAAALSGGLGLAPSANLHPGVHALFEPVHGSAPDIAGTGKANPIAAIRCVSLLLEHLGQAGLAAEVERAVAAALERGPKTPDLGGEAGTEEVGSWIAERVSESLSTPDGTVGHG